MLVVLLVIASGSLVLFAVAPAHSAPIAAAAVPAVNPADPPTHGDLVVTSGETYTIEPTSGHALYYQGGNITVESGGTLIVQNTTLSFVQSINNNGTLAQRVSGLYSFSDAGTVSFANSVITTDPYVLNAYVKLPVTITGTMTLWNTTMAFPGSIDVSGTGAVLTLNDSAVTTNPAVLADSPPFPPAVWADSVYAATVTASAGAQINLFHSSLNDTYSNPVTVGPSDLASIPGPNATFFSGTLPLATANLTFPGFPTGSVGSASIAQAWLYASGYSAGWVSVSYSNTNTTGNSTADVSLYFAGTTYLLGTIVLPAMTSGNVSIPLTPQALAAINAAGELVYFSSDTSILFSAITSYPVTNVTGVGLYLAPNSIEYNVTVTGAGTEMNTVDSTMDLNWVPTDSSPVVAPFASNKLMVLDGAVAYLANLTVSNPYPEVYSTSAVVTDASSTAYLFRWAEFHITSAATGVNVSGASVSPFYGYNNGQANNATANGLNDLAVTSPAIWSYLKYWDGEHGVTQYGTSNVNGQASVLLASAELDSTSLPTGTYLGDYNVGFRVPYVANTTWTAFAASPYPTGTALGSVGYGFPDAQNVIVPTAPPEVQFVSFTGPSGTSLNVNDQYSSNGTIFINGPGEATITLTATPVGGGSQITIGGDVTGNGTFQFFWTAPLPLSAGTSYLIQATASYKGVETTHTVGTYSIPSTTSPVGFLLQKFLGLPLWVWIAIAAAAIVAILVVLMIFRRQAAGKLVECGECGELIPEDATVCPKCGAEFESDMVRCSRCSATIPANSKFCPECSAQLLGTPGEGAADPERQAYADFTEKFRTEAKRELGDNYTESAFWDWWKRQATYVPFSQWSAQQNKGVPRAGMSAPPVGSEAVPPAAPPPKGGAPPAGGAAAAPAAMTAPPPTAVPPPPASGGTSLKPCPNCGKEIPPEYLVCPLCGAVTQ